MRDYLFRETLEEASPCVAGLINREAERQRRKLIMIPSESCAPKAVREALGSVFQNVYAEGYPRERTMRYSEDLLLDQSHCLVYYRRYANRRFYKGVDYVDIVESLAARRAAGCFASPEYPADHIYANVQALSGSAANLAVYDALLENGDVFMGLDLFQGGHLTHGSEFNQSGKRYRVVSYGVDPKTEKLDYGKIRELALEHRPKLIVAGYTSYPWAPDWKRFRKIADEVGAYLMADIAHTAGLVIGGVYPNPVGVADVTVFTTHKTLGGPRGAVILTTDEETAALIDTSVFPGAQGGPHVNKMAALAVLFKLAAGDRFRELQRRMVENAAALAKAFTDEGLTVVYGGTDTHIVMVDVSPVGSKPKEITPFTPGIPLRGEIAARILDLAGIVVNKNTIPGDESTALARGIRFGTPWVTQRGLGPGDMKRIAEIVQRVVTGIRPFSYQGIRGELPRGKIALDILESAKEEAAGLAEQAGYDADITESGYPHYWRLGRPEAASRGMEPAGSPAGSSVKGAPGRGVPTVEAEPSVLLEISGWRARAFLQEVCTLNVSRLSPGEEGRSFLLDEEGRLLADVLVTSLPPDLHGRDRYRVRLKTGADRASAWLRGIADGYILFDTGDIFRKVQGPVVVEGDPGGTIRNTEAAAGPAGSEGPYTPEKPGTSGIELYERHPECFDLTLPYFVGQVEVVRAVGAEKVEKTCGSLEAWDPDAAASLGTGEDSKQVPKRTELFERHKLLGARMVDFAGWEMPVWYSSVREEHAAVRNAAGLFDVSHMGGIEVTGPHAIEFLDTVVSNYVHWLDDGESCYSYLLDPEGGVIDDLIVYRLNRERFVLVVNAANERKDWDWLTAVDGGRVRIDADRPWVRPAVRAHLENLKSTTRRERQLRGIALQGPESLRILELCCETEDAVRALRRLGRTRCTELTLAGIPLIVARTGYTGEEYGYELMAHPDAVGELWDLLLEKGESHGITPCGLACRDSTRIEAGLPLYGHELAGPLEISPLEAGFAGYVKLHKPFFIGRDRLSMEELARTREIVRWRVEKKGVRRPDLEDPVVDRNGKVIGSVTSCSLDSEGFLNGMALVDRKYTDPGSEIGIFVFPGGGDRPGKTLREVSFEAGKRVPVPVRGTVVSRFPVG
jgi:glycine hydroxymethyltransferase